MDTVFSFTSLEQAQDAVRTHERVSARGAGTKPGLSRGGERVVVLNCSEYTGITEYDPGEYTFTARAGTTLGEIRSALEREGQYLPFDPLFGRHGATLGGTVAANLSGPRRLRFGGIRDFIIGVQFIDGEGRVLRGGGKVVKNAAGFDFPKLLTGSIGRLGVLAEITMKVFPKPETVLWAESDLTTMAEGFQLAARLAGGAFELDAVEISVGPSPRIQICLAGKGDALLARLENLNRKLGISFQPVSGALRSGVEEWENLRVRTGELSRVRVPVTPASAQRMENELQALEVWRHYSVAGAVALLAWPDALGEERLAALLQKFNLGGMNLDGSRALTGALPAMEVWNRLKLALDPKGRFPAFA